MRPFLIAFQFLTCLPVRIDAPASREVRASYLFYPVIGALIGSAGVVLHRLCAPIFPESFSVAVVLAFFVWITGGLHEDGLADVADGMGGWTRERRLEIMKDSRIGAFGVVAIVVVLLVKYSALTSMSADRLDRAFLAAHILGRWAFLPLGYFNPAARDGLGSELVRHIHGLVVFAATVLSVAAAFWLYGIAGVGAALLAAVIVVLASAYFRSQLGGVTGDCFGATFQFVEISTYAAFLA